MGTDMHEKTHIMSKQRSYSSTACSQREVNPAESGPAASLEQQLGNSERSHKHSSTPCNRTRLVSRPHVRDEQQESFDRAQTELKGADHLEQGDDEGTTVILGQAERSQLAVGRTAVIKYIVACSVAAQITSQATMRLVLSMKRA